MHPTDGELRAYLDREMMSVDQVAVHHMATCLTCRSRVAHLAADVHVTEDLLASLDHAMPAPPPRTSRRPVRQWIRALATAALVTLCVSGIAVAVARSGGPLHRLVAHVFAMVPHTKAPTVHAAPAPAADSGGAAPVGALGVAFDPVGHLVLRLPVSDQPSTVRITFTDRNTAAVRVQNGTVAFALVGDTVEVSQGGRANHYLLTVPRRLGRLEIRVGDRPLYVARWDARRGVRSPSDTVVTLSTDVRRDS